MDTDRLRANIQRGADRAGTSADEEANRQIAQIPAGRFGNSEEFGNLCAFLCSRHAGYLTGQNFLVDGGLIPTAF
ncbi:MAG TPA: SDR family oxidoreductase [Afifellaceae bacterium]|nr:SDR family oxidoreductase [Afifellaceae bacterium]